ncbi:MAG: benzoyl-CoA 2,3-epoxidase subunit BoxA [Burkholderiaceae bacterium]|jgi:benzoyl-CoA 2,3-dioxygenase component A
MGATDAEVLIRQHLIDPEVCIRCNTCEDTCPIDAISHDDRNYVVDASICNGCNACLPPCPTGSIDNWRTVPKSAAYSVVEQYSWDELPTQQPLDAAAAVASAEQPPQHNAALSITSPSAPWSAAQPSLNLYDIKQPVLATVAGNFRLTDADTESDIRHIVLDFGQTHFPVLEGQSIGIIPPGTDEAGRPHYLRLYSVASPRNGERPGYNNLSLTVKRVLLDHDGKSVRGVASNYLCDLQKGDTVQVTGPFGAHYLMPNHAGSNIVMICTGTGAAPMRAMTEYRRRLMAQGTAVEGKLMLFFGARRPGELPYFGPLRKLPSSFIDIHLAFSRVDAEPKTYVQDKLHDAAAAVADVLQADTYFYICGVKGMEAGVMDALREIAEGAGIDWSSLHARMIDEGRFHVETY